MTWTELLTRPFGVEDVESVDELRSAFGASWAHGAPAWVFFGCLALGAGTAGAYLLFRRRGSRRSAILLAILRAFVFCILFIGLAEPLLTVSLLRKPKPLLWLLMDGSESMAIEEPTALAAQAHAAAPNKAPRIEQVKAVLGKPDGVLPRLRKRFRMRAFQFDRPDGLRALDWDAESEASARPDALAKQLTATGPVTAIGAAFEDVLRRQASSRLSALLVFSDFSQNAGPPAAAAAKKLGMPVFTVGVGQPAPIDLAIDVQAPLLMKKAERSAVKIALRQSGLDGRRARLRVTIEPVGTTQTGGSLLAGLVGEREIELREGTILVELPFVPTEIGRFTFHAQAEPLEGESIVENNSASREVTVRDDFLRVSYVEYEPTWEWRFIKEVFHRDQLVGMRGFRTFLRSADPQVRQSNELFLPTLTPTRGEFFSNDVIFLGDMPASALSTRFCELVKEFVGKFGGGLVVLSGPRFGPGQLASTPLAEILPVVADPAVKLRDTQEFRLRLTAEAAQTDFMRLGLDASENTKAWENLGPLPWYQPVVRLSPLSYAVAQHPTDTCADSKTPQPLIAVRRYGAGEVIYLAFNETWRLRRKFGERYYREFWGQMIHRLGLSHALGAQKRFVLRTDRQQYQAEERAIVTVEAYDANFEPLRAEELPEQRLAAELITPLQASRGDGKGRWLSIPQLREGVYETQVPLFEGGEHRIRVQDPVTASFSEATFQVANVSIERRGALRNASLEAEIVQATGGKAYDLESLSAFPDEVQVAERKETEVRVLSLWHHWVSFSVVVGFLLLEWLLRKRVGLP